MSNTPDLEDILGPDMSRFAPVSPLLIKPRSRGLFAVYLLQDGQVVLYTNKGAAFTDAHRAKLDAMGVSQVYIPLEQYKEYEQYLRESLDTILTDSVIPIEVRSRAWLHCSIATARSVFAEKLPKPLLRSRFRQVKQLVKESIDFFGTPGAMENVIHLVAKGFKGYNHAVGVMVLNYFILRAMGQRDADLLRRTALGAMLHDIGKTTLAPALLERNPDLLSQEEWEKYKAHSSIGVGLCMSLQLSQEAYNSILFHHEQADGKGFPSGLQAEDMPAYVHSILVCNCYDNLTRSAPWRPAFTPFEALQRMQRRKERYDPEALKALILVLSNAAVLDEPATCD